jgi:translocation and assembly module TamB
VLAVLLAIGAAWACLYTPAGEQWLAARLGGWLSTPGQSVSVTGLDLRWPLDLRLQRIDLADPQGEWLALDDVAIDWRPLRLLAGEVSAESVAIGNIILSRRPVATDGGRLPDGWPRLPLAIRVNHATAQLSAAPAVTGEPLDLLATGHATVGGGSSDIDVILRHPDTETTEAHLRLAYDRPSATLALDLAASRAISRLLVRLGHAEDRIPALDLRLSGDGALSDWRGTVSGTLGDRPCLDGTVRLSRSEDWGTAIDVGMAPECLPDATTARLLAGAPIALRASLAFADGRLARIAEARLRSAALTAGVSGTLDGRLGIRFSVETGELDRFGALAGLNAGGNLQATGTVTGTLEQPVIEAHLASSDGHVEDGRWRDLSADLQLNPTGADGWMAGTTGTVTASEPALGDGGDGTVSWVGTVHYRPADGVYRLAELRLNGFGGQASLFGTVGRDGALSLRGQARSNRLAAFSHLAGVAGLNGRAAAWLSVSGRPGTGVTARLWGDANALNTGDTRMNQLLGRSPRFAAITLYRAGTVPIVSARLAGDNLRLRLRGRALPDLELGWRLDLPKLAALSWPDLGGEATGRGLLVGTVRAPQMTGVLRGAVTYRKEPYELRAALGAATPTTPTGAFHLGLRNEQLAAEVSSRFRLSKTIDLTDLTLFSRETRVVGNLKIADGGVTGHLVGHSANLAPWSQMAGTPLAGALTVDARLNHDGRRQEVDATVSGDGLAVAGRRVGHLSGRAGIADVGVPRVSARLQASGVEAGGASLRTLDLRADGTPAAIDFDLRASGGGERQPMTLASQGSLRSQDDSQVLRLATLSVQGGGVSGRLAGPTTVTRRGDAVTVAPTRLELGGGRIDLSGEIRGTALDLRLALANTPLELVNATLPPDFKAVGAVSATARLGGTIDAPALTFDGTGRGLGLAGAGRERLNLSLHGRWQDRTLDITADANGTRGTSANLTARLPLLANLSMPDNGPISGRLRGTGDLGRLTAALPLPGHRFAGKLAGDISLAGTIGQPSVSGQASLREGFYEYYDTGTRIRALQATLTAGNSRTFALSLSGNDGRGRGRISGEGQVELQGLLPSWTVAVTLNDFGLIDLDAARARASGQLSFTGRGDAGRLAGKVSVGPGEYQITEGLFGGGVPKLTNVVEVHRPGNRPAVRVSRAAPHVTQDEPEMVFPVDIALAVDADVDRLFVRGRGLESDWHGRLAIGGTARNPSISGQLEAAHGAYDFVGKRFQITGGRVTFEGGGKVDPLLDVTAEASANDITAQVKVGGTATKPRVEFTSIPALPNDEVLSRLLFGRSIGQLSVAQQVQIARAAASLTGKGQFDPIGNLRNQLGLDLLDVGVSDQSKSGLSPNVTVGKYLDRDTFLRVEEGLGGNEGKMAIERRLGRGLSVEADVGQRGTGGVGLSWRKDY